MLETLMLPNLVNIEVPKPPPPPPVVVGVEHAAKTSARPETATRPNRFDTPTFILNLLERVNTRRIARQINAGFTHATLLPETTVLRHSLEPVNALEAERGDPDENRTRVHALKEVPSPF